jgi:C-terminal processing protease CtpA/Prc
MIKQGLFIIFIFFGLLACQKPKDNAIDSQTLEINDFVWKGMNALYLWKNEVPDLADDQFNDQTALNDYLQNFNSPDALFEHLVYNRQQVDKWSWIVSDYEALLKLFQGIRKTTGMHIGLVYEPGYTNRVFAYVRYVTPNSPADLQGIQRGDLFRKVNGQYLTDTNYQDLLGADVLTIELASWDGQSLNDTGQVMSLQKDIIQENPVFIKSIIITPQHTVGYLMYNGFVSTYDHQLNEAFAYFKANQVDRLVVDLRYNPGGSVQTMQYLASMITGQFTGQVLLKYQWHSQMQAWMSEHYPENLQRYFVTTMADGTPINHLNADEVVFVTTKSSASASESLINCLKPYIDITQIGTETHGKYTASITLFDSPDFSSINVNPAHKWAMQPIVLKVSNADNQTDFINGLTPDIYQPEDYFNLGILGDPSEPLLQTALNYINTPNIAPRSSSHQFKELYYKETPFTGEMYISRDEISLPDFK